MKKESGFTMIELMIVILIVGQLVAIAAPFYTRLVARAKISEAMKWGSVARRAVLEHRIATGNWPPNLETILSTDTDVDTLLGHHIITMWGNSVTVSDVSLYYINIWLDPEQVEPEPGNAYVILNFVFKEEGTGACGPVFTNHTHFYPSTCRTHYSDFYATL